jgi:hypothetical protein
MSWVRFDVESDGRFLASVKDLGTARATRILLKLRDMSGCVSWTELTTDYSWHEIVVVPTESFPGAHQLYSFILYFSPIEVYEIVAHNDAPPDVICVLARVTRRV